MGFFLNNDMLHLSGRGIKQGYTRRTHVFGYNTNINRVPQK